jgi:hypothetical protein
LQLLPMQVLDCANACCGVLQLYQCMRALLRSCGNDIALPSPAI